MKRVQQELQRGQALLPVNNCALLHLAGLLLNLLEHHRTEKVWMMLVAGPDQNPIRDAHDVIPQRVPLVFLVPDIRPLEQGDHESLRLHEHHLGRTYLSLHGTMFLLLR